MCVTDGGMRGVVMFTEREWQSGPAQATALDNDTEGEDEDPSRVPGRRGCSQPMAQNLRASMRKVG